jgi:hypothetical protein
MEKRKTRIAKQSRVSAKKFFLHSFQSKEKVFCPLTVWLADLPSGRKGSGVLPAKKVSRLALLYDSEGKRAKKIKSPRVHPRASE